MLSVCLSAGLGGKITKGDGSMHRTVPQLGTVPNTKCQKKKMSCHLSTGTWHTLQINLKLPLHCRTTPHRRGQEAEGCHLQTLPPATWLSRWRSLWDLDSWQRGHRCPLGHFLWSSAGHILQSEKYSRKYALPG